MVPNLVVGAAFPIFARAARDDQDRLAYGVSRVFQACVVFGGALFVALFLGAPFVIDVVAGADFEPSADVLRIQAAALMFAFPNSVLFYVLLTLRRYRILLALSSGVLAVNLLLAGILGSEWGAQGAAVATAAAEFGLTVAAYLAVRAVAPHVVPGLGVVPKVALAIGLATLLLADRAVAAARRLSPALVVYAAVVLALRAVPA